MAQFGVASDHIFMTAAIKLKYCKRRARVARYNRPIVYRTYRHFGVNEEVLLTWAGTRSSAI